MRRFFRPFCSLLLALSPASVAQAEGSMAATEPNAARAHAFALAPLGVNPELPNELNLLWEKRPQVGAIESIVGTSSGLILAAGSKGETLGLNAQGEALWSRSHGALWLIPPFATALGFAGIVDPLRVVGLTASGGPSFEHPLPPEEGSAPLLTLALSNGGMAVSTGRRLFLLDHTGKRTVDLALPENAEALAKVGPQLVLVLSSGRVLALSASGTLGDRGSLGGKPDAVAGYGSQQLLASVANGVFTFNLRSRRSAPVLTLDPQQRGLSLNVTANGFHWITRDGRLLRVDRSGKHHFTLALTPTGQQAATAPAFLIETDKAGKAAVATPDARVLLVDRAGVVIREQSLRCARITALGRGVGRLFVGCSDGSIVALGAAKG